MTNYRLWNAPNGFGSFQAQHIIMQKTISNDMVFSYLHDTKLLDTRNFWAGNGIMLPTSADLAASQGLALHQSGHFQLAQIQPAIIQQIELQNVFNVKFYNYFQNLFSEYQYRIFAGNDIIVLVI